MADNPAEGTTIKFRVKVHIPGEYEYFGSWVTSFGERAVRSASPTLRLLRLWANDELVYGAISGFRKPEHSFRFYPGSSQQGAVQNGDPTKPKPAMEFPKLSGNLFFSGGGSGGSAPSGGGVPMGSGNPAIPGQGWQQPVPDPNAPPRVTSTVNYRDLICIFAQSWPLKDYGGSVPALSAELQEVEGVNTVGSVQGINSFGMAWGAKLAFFALDTETDRFNSIDFVELFGPHNFHLRFNLSEVRISNRTRTRAALTENKNIWIGDQTPSDEEQPGGEVIPGGGTRQRPENWVYAVSDDNKLAVIQTEGRPLRKRVFDTLTGQEYAVYNGDKPWLDTLSFRLFWGSQDWHYLMATVDGGIQIYEYVGDRIQLAMPGLFNFTHELGFTPVCLTKGLYRDGHVEVYATHSGGIERILLSAAGNGKPIIFQQTAWTAPAGHTPYMSWASRVDQSIVCLVLKDAVTRNGYAIKVAIDGTIEWQSADFLLPKEIKPHFRTQEATGDIESGTLVIRNDMVSMIGINYITTDDGVVKPDLITADVLEGVTADNLRVVWDSGTDTLFTNGRMYARINVPAGAGILLKQLLLAFAIRAGYTEDKVFFNGMDHMELTGYVVSGQMSFGQICDQLAQLYGFTWTERNDELLFNFNYAIDGAFTVGTVIPGTALALLTEQSDSGENSLSRNLEDNYPSILTLTYYDPGNDYEQGFQVYKRRKYPMPTHNSHDRADLSLPIVLTNALAAKLLQDMIYRIWSTKVGASIRLPPEYMVIDPGDSIAYTVDNYQYLVTVTLAMINGDNSVSLTLVEGREALNNIEAETYEPSIEPPAAAGQPVNTLLIDAPVFDPSQVSDNTATLSVWVAAGGFSLNSFTGGVITFGNSPNNIPVAQLFTPDEECYISFVKSITGPESLVLYELDTETVIRVSRGNIPNAMLRSATLEEMLGNVNLCVIGSPGAWEYFTFGAFEIVDDDTIELTQLLRGRYGTDIFSGSAAGGEYFAFVYNWKQVNYPAEWVATRQRAYYTGASPAQPKWQVSTQVVLPEGNSRRPYAVRGLSAKRESNGDITLAWERRSRYTNYPPLAVSDNGLLDELVETYEILVYDTNTGDLILTATSNVEGYVLDAATQASLGLSPDMFLITPLVRQVSTAYTPALPGFGRVSTLAISGMNISLHASFDGRGALTSNAFVGILPVELGANFMGEGGFTIAIVDLPAVELEANFSGGARFSVEPITYGAVFDGQGSLRAETKQPILVAYKHYRLLVTRNRGGGYTGVSEWYLMRKGVPVYGGVASAIDTYDTSGNFAAANAFNGNHRDRWLSADNGGPGYGSPVNPPDWIKYSYPEPVFIDQIAVAGGGDNINGANPYFFEFQGSNNDIDWVIIQNISYADVGTWPGANATEFPVIPGVEANKAIRFQGDGWFTAGLSPTPEKVFSATFSGEGDFLLKSGAVTVAPAATPTEVGIRRNEPFIRYTGEANRFSHGADGVGRVIFAGADIVAGDLLLVVPLGVIYDVATPGYEPLHPPTSNQPNTVYTKVATGADGAATDLTLEVMGWAGDARVTLTVVGGIDPSVPIEAYGWATGGSSATSVAAAPALTPGGAKRLLLDFVGRYGSKGDTDIILPSVAGLVQHRKTVLQGGTALEAHKLLGTSAATQAARNYNLAAPGLWSTESLIIKGTEIIIPSKAPHRYWRVFIAANNGEPAYTVVGELEFANTLGAPMDGTDLTGSGTPIASSSTTPDNIPLSAFNNTYTAANTAPAAGVQRYWSTAVNLATNCWLGYDFGEGNGKDIREVRILCDRDVLRAPKTIQVQYSDDGTTWVNDEWNIPNQTGWAIGQWRSFNRPQA